MAFSLLLAAILPVFSALNHRTGYVKIITSCRVSDATNHTITNMTTADACAVMCLMESGGCAAYQWDIQSNTCRLQASLNLTPSSNAHNIGVMMDNESLSCARNSDCPAPYACKETTTSCGSLGRSCQPPEEDCAAILASHPGSPSGVYKILPANTETYVRVWCDMDTDGGGWTVFLKRLDGSVDFYRELVDYQRGFGEVSGEYWLGLDFLHALTSSKTKTYQLRVDMSDWEGFSAFSLYQSMAVGTETDGYRLTLGSFLSGNGGNGLRKSKDRPFTTKDLDRDAHRNNCARYHHGGFWYKQCSEAHPTSRYYHGGNYRSVTNDGIQWRTWGAHTETFYSLKTIEMKLRPAP